MCSPPAMAQEPLEPVGGVGSPADDGGHVGAYTIPSDLMDQSGPAAAQRSGLQFIPDASFALGGALVVGLLLAIVAWVTLYVGM